MVLDGIAGMHFMTTGKFKHFVAILKAHFFVLQTFFSSLKKRTKFQEQKILLQKYRFHLFY
jgi:hypothetical protein